MMKTGCTIKKTGLFLFMALTLPLLLSCIERDNWWDPYNGCHPTEELPEIRSRNKQVIDKQQDALKGLGITVAELQAQYDDRLLKNRQQEIINKQIADSIAVILAANEQTAVSNVKKTCVEAQEKLHLLMPKMGIITSVTSAAVRSSIAQLEQNRILVLELVSQAQNECPKRTVLSAGYIDTITRPYDSLFSKWDSVARSIEAYAAVVDSVNKLIENANAARAALELQVDNYNDSLSNCRIQWITDPVVLKQALDTAGPGDTIPVGGLISKLDNVSLVNKGAPGGGWIVILGDPSARTDIALEAVTVAASQKISFVNIDFSGNSRGCGARVIDSSNNVEFIGCSFTGNSQHGCDVVNSNNVKFVNCVFLGNGASQDTASFSGLRISGYSQNITANGILAANNGGHGIEIDKSLVTIRQATIADNKRHGVHYSGKSNEGSFTAFATIFCFNEQFGIYRNDEQVTRDIFVLRSDENWFFSNGLGMIGGRAGLEEVNDATEADPMFVDKANGNYQIGQGSSIYGKGCGYQY